MMDSAATRVAALSFAGTQMAWDASQAAWADGDSEAHSLAGRYHKLFAYLYHWAVAQDRGG